MTITQRDVATLRELAKRVAEVGHLPIMAERVRLWKQHHALQPERPMILVFPEGSWRELLPQEALTCEGEQARAIEWTLRSRLYHHAHIHDDMVIEPRWIVHRRIGHTGWGLEPERTPSSDPTGAWAFRPVIHTPDDLAKLRYPTVTYDEAGTARDIALAHELFDGILEIEVKGIAHLSFHLMQVYTELRGLEQVMVDMVANPDMLHQAMAFMEEGHRRLVQQYVERNLLSLNNDGTYQSSGGVGYTDLLPAPGYEPGRVRPIDMWASAESQELAQVSPAMHAEFALQYERRLLEPFGLTGYGCCEDLTRKLDDVLAIPNMRRVSISPWADVARCAERLGADYILSWKPHPGYLVGTFDEERVRRYIREALDAAQGCVMEMVLKDTHTCEHHPERFTRWTEIAREEVEGR